MVREIVTLDGVKIDITPADLDGDGQTGGVETLRQNINQGIQPVVQPTELGESLKELNSDSIESLSRMSGIDMRARLQYIEIASILALDSLVSLGCLPIKCLSFTRQKKRLSVSLNGKGREEIVSVVSGKREMDAKLGGMSGFGERIKGFMGMGGK